MKAQLVKTFIKAAAIVALATSIANCGAMPEESITETTYQPSSQPVDPAVDAEGDDNAVLIIDNPGGSLMRIGATSVQVTNRSVC